MYAYRIYRDDIKSFIQDCEDDGESQAGGRLLHLLQVDNSVYLSSFCNKKKLTQKIIIDPIKPFLQIMEAKNVLVVVSRWYGGIHLGSDRFRHINNAARQVLTAADMIPEKNKKKS